MKILILAFLVSTSFAESTIPSRAKRMKAIEDAGLTEFTQKMDELDQDLLYLRAGKNTEQELKRFYPNLPTEKLRAFVKVAR